MIEKFKDVVETTIDGCLVIVPNKYEGDWPDRRRIYTLYDESIMPCNFVESKVVFGPGNHIVGFHGDNKTWKLFSCMQGTMEFGVVDCRKSYPSFRKTFHVKITKQGGKSLLVPPGCLNANWAQSDHCLLYHTSEPYTGPQDQETVIWNSPGLEDIPWFFKKPYKYQPDIYERDKKGKQLSEVIFE